MYFFLSETAKKGWYVGVVSVSLLYDKFVPFF